MSKASGKACGKDVMTEFYEMSRSRNKKSLKEIKEKEAAYTGEKFNQSENPNLKCSSEPDTSNSQPSQTLSIDHHMNTTTDIMQNLPSSNGQYTITPKEDFGFLLREEAFQRKFLKACPFAIIQIIDNQLCIVYENKAEYEQQIESFYRNISNETHSISIERYTVLVEKGKVQRYVSAQLHKQSLLCFWSIYASEGQHFLSVKGGSKDMVIKGFKAINELVPMKSISIVISPELNQKIKQIETKYFEYGMVFGNDIGSEDLNVVGSSDIIDDFERDLKMVVATVQAHITVRKEKVEDCKPKWHTACKKAFPFDVEVVGMETIAKDTLDKVLQDITTTNISRQIKQFSLQIKQSEIDEAKKSLKKLEINGLQIHFDEMSNTVTCEGTKKQIDIAREILEKFEDKEVCFDMTEDDFTTLLYITNDENWRSFIKKYKFENGKAQFLLDKAGDPKKFRKSIQSKLQSIRILEGIEVIPPSKIEEQFSILQTQVKDKLTGVFCFLSLDKKKIIIKAESYKTVQQAKSMVEINLGIFRLSECRQNRQFASSDLIGPGSVASLKVSETDLRTRMTKEGITVFVYSAEIGNLKVETLVNAANKDLVHDGGIAYQMSKAAGYVLEKECDDFVSKHGPLGVGTCCSTTAGELPYRSIIHAVGPMWHSYSHKNKQQCLDDLKQTVISALKEAEQQMLKSIAFPSIGSGLFGVPKDQCAQQFFIAVREYSDRWEGESTIREIHFIDRDQEMRNLVKTKFGHYIESNTDFANS